MGMMEVNADLCVAVPADTGGEELPVELSSRVRNKHVGSKDVLHEIHGLIVKKDQVQRERERERDRERESRERNMYASVSSVWM